MKRRQGKNGDLEREYRDLTRRILALGWARPGSVIRRFMPCGQPGCRCMAKPPQLHGPYFQWSHKVAGKTVSLRLSEDQARLAKEWAANYKKIKTLLRRMERLALQQTN